MSAPNFDISALSQTVRRHDHDRYASTMFAPVDRRADLLALYAVNIELSQIRTLVREAMAGMIRLQWWREVADGRRDPEALKNPVSGPFIDVVRRRQLSLTLFQAMIDSREKDLQPIPFETLADLTSYAEATSGRLTQAAALCLDDAADEAAAEHAGIAWAMVGLLRSFRFHAAQGWMTLPLEVLRQSGIDPDDVAAGRADGKTLSKAVLALCDQAEHHLNAAAKAKPGRAMLPAVLPAVAAKAYLRQIRAAGGDVFDMRVYRPRPMPLRLLWAATTGRL